MKYVLRTIAPFLLGVSIASQVLAQSGNASITGLVTDPSGAVIPDVMITAKSVQTGITARATSNSAGIYNFPSLQPGIYQLSSETQGFKPLIYNDVALVVSSQIKINFALQLASNTESIEVSQRVDSPLLETSSTIGGVISNQRVNELPLADHSVLGLLATSAGVVGDNFSGNRAGALNLTLNGVNVGGQRNDQGASGATFFNSIDLVDEIRVVTSPADAELGRGAGQVQLTMRSGTNTFHGSLFEGLRNTALTANTYFNNLNGVQRPVLIRNQFGGRIGGPVIRNKTFFFFLYEGQRQTSSSPITQTVLTGTARQGIFRYFPGVRNGNAISATPTVDATGNPVQPAGAGALQSVNLFAQDPSRPQADPTGFMKSLLGAVPLPNNFQVGDGLNTAGFVWNQPGYSNRDGYAFRVDHYINTKHNFNYSYQHETTLIPYIPPAYPGSPTDSTVAGSGYFMSAQLTTIVSPTIVNSLSAGLQHPYALSLAASYSPQGQPLLAVSSGTKYIVTPTSFTTPMRATMTNSKNVNPFYSVSDTVSKVAGRHTWKAGAEYHLLYSNSFNSNTNVVPQTILGAGGTPVTGISALAGIGANQALAQNILTDLAGSVTSVNQTYIVGDSKNATYLPGYANLRIWETREFQGFVKDDFKVRQDLTLNLGVRYEFYSVPWEQRGVATGIVGGSAGLFGISGRDFSSLFRPGASGGSLTQTLPIGKNSPNPGQLLYNNDYNNFGPAVGLSWSLPYFGKDKTVLRAGYSISYTKPPPFKAIDTIIDLQAGGQTNIVYQPSTYLNLRGVQLPLPVTAPPFSTVPLTDRTQNAGAYDTNYRTAYVQNFNLSLQRELPWKSTLSLRFVGSKGTKLQQTFDINEANIFENGILDAYNVTRAGGNAPLFDRMFSGLNLGSGVVNGTSVTGSAALRASTLTQAFFANNNVGGLANFLNTTTNFTGVAGGLLSRAGLPPNFIVVNPQYSSAFGQASGVGYSCSCANSTYNAFQAEFSKRLSSGFGFLSNYTYSKALGSSEGGNGATNFRTLRNWSLDKRRLSFDRNHVLKFSGTYELPFGPGKKFASGTHGFVSRLVEGWQFGAIFTGLSGAPINITAATSSFNQLTGNASATQPLAADSGAITKVGNGVTYFSGLRQVTDPSVATLTSQQSLNTKSTMLAIANEQGQPILVNPTPGTLGNLGFNFLSGPGSWNLDLNLLKRIHVTERWLAELRIDALNAPNNAQFANPTSDINNINFGRITNVLQGSARVVVANLRITF